MATHNPADHRMKASMKASSEAYKSVDFDGSGDLNFDEFVKLPLNKGKPRAELRKKFDEADIDASGRIDKKEFLRMALMDGLAGAHQQVTGLFKQIDTDGSKNISKVEFRRAVRSLRFEADTGDIDRVFDAFDKDLSGEISVTELAAALTPQYVERNRAELRKKLARDPRATPPTGDTRSGAAGGRAQASAGTPSKVDERPRVSAEHASPSRAALGGAKTGGGGGRGGPLHEPLSSRMAKTAAAAAQYRGDLIGFMLRAECAGIEKGFFFVAGCLAGMILARK